MPQGDWAGFTRPGVAGSARPDVREASPRHYYRHQHELFGDSTHLRHGSVPGRRQLRRRAGGRGRARVQAALDKAHPGARWMMLAWQGNPRQSLLAGRGSKHLFIIDIDHNRVPRDDRAKDFQRRTVPVRRHLGIRRSHHPRRRHAQHHRKAAADGAHQPNMVGTAVFTEGMDTNPFAFDLFTEMAWPDAPVDLSQWTAAYVQRRYGAADPHALAAWQILLATAYDIRIDKVKFNSERDAAQESLFNAQPGLTSIAPRTGRPRRCATTRQPSPARCPRCSRWRPRCGTARPIATIWSTSHARPWPTKAARCCRESRRHYEPSHRRRFEALSKRWLHLMRLQDSLLASNGNFLLGRWLDTGQRLGLDVRRTGAAGYDARSILTTWGDRKASEGADLHDYGNKDWAGLTRDYYLPRWKKLLRHAGHVPAHGQAAGSDRLVRDGRRLEPWPPALRDPAARRQLGDRGADRPDPEGHRPASRAVATHAATECETPPLRQHDRAACRTSRESHRANTRGRQPADLPQCQHVTQQCLRRDFGAGAGSLDHQRLRVVAGRAERELVVGAVQARGRVRG